MVQALLISAQDLALLLCTELARQISVQAHAYQVDTELVVQTNALDLVLQEGTVLVLPLSVLMHVLLVSFQPLDQQRVSFVQQLHTVHHLAFHLQSVLELSCALPGLMRYLERPRQMYQVQQFAQAVHWVSFLQPALHLALIVQRADSVQVLPTHALEFVALALILYLDQQLALLAQLVSMAQH
jgi:hypothetical protein